MDIGETLGQVYSFLFESFAGIGVLVGISLVLCIIISYLMERKTRRIYADRGPRTEEDEWSLFDDDDEDDDEDEDA